MRVHFLSVVFLSVNDIPLKLGVGQNQFHARWCACGAWLIVGEFGFHARHTANSSSKRAWFLNSPTISVNTQRPFTKNQDEMQKSNAHPTGASQTAPLRGL